VLPVASGIASGMRMSLQSSHRHGWNLGSLASAHSGQWSLVGTVPVARTCPRRLKPSTLNPQPHARWQGETVKRDEQGEAGARVVTNACRDT
jgi:hypothetical protein